MWFIYGKQIGEVETLQLISDMGGKLEIEL